MFETKETSLKENINKGGPLKENINKEEPIILKQGDAKIKDKTNKEVLRIKL